MSVDCTTKEVLGNISLPSSNILDGNYSWKFKSLIPQSIDNPAEVWYTADTAPTVLHPLPPLPPMSSSYSYLHPIPAPSLDAFLMISLGLLSVPLHGGKSVLLPFLQGFFVLKFVRLWLFLSVLFILWNATNGGDWQYQHSLTVIHIDSQTENNCIICLSMSRHSAGFMRYMYDLDTKVII